MSELEPISALGAAEPRVATRGALMLRENAGLGLTSLALRRGAAEPAPFGLALPGPGAFVADAGASAFWTGPGQWMILREGGADEDVAAELAAEAPGCSVTEQTDGWVAVEIATSQGAAPVERLLEKLVNLPPASLSPDRATRTVLHHMSVFVIRRSEDRLAVLGMRSAAGTLWHVLDAAAKRLETNE